jgi:hypothetical protein
MQAESAMDQMDWIEKITGVIASLLSSQSPERVSYEWHTLNYLYISDLGLYEIIFLFTASSAEP